MSDLRELSFKIINRSVYGIVCDDKLREQIEQELKEEIKKFYQPKLERWLELLSTDGCNSKSMVMNDIQFMLKEINEQGGKL